MTNSRVSRLLRRLSSVAALWIALATSAAAWGSDGHSIIAELAQRRLTPEARQRVRELIGEASLASISNWADDIRSERPDTPRWHFVNIPLSSESYDAGSACAINPQGDCIIAALDRQARILGDSQAPLDARRDALKFVAHLVADIHQPLHVIADFQGGNAIRVQFFADPMGLRKEWTTLHLLWDIGLIEYKFRGWGAYVDYLEREWLTKNGVADVAFAPKEWALESHQIARAPGFVPDSGSDLGADYVALAQPLLDKQLAAAGLRLAAALNNFLK